MKNDEQKEEWIKKKKWKKKTKEINAQTERKDEADESF